MVCGVHKSMLNKWGGTKLFTKLANIIESGISSSFDCALLAYLRGECTYLSRTRRRRRLGNWRGIMSKWPAHAFTLARWHVENREHIFLLATYRRSWRDPPITGCCDSFFFECYDNWKLSPSLISRHTQLLHSMRKISLLDFNDTVFDQSIIFFSQLKSVFMKPHKKIKVTD